MEKLVPITFGITGHRDLLPEDVPRAIDCVNSILKEYRRRYKYSPFLFISPLANGSDIVAAEVALASDENLFLQVVFPYPEIEYITTISSDQLDLFHRLKNHPRSLMPITLDPKEHMECEDKKKSYRMLGQFVAQNSHFLFAFKNIENEFKIGGTADIVRYRRNGCIDLGDGTPANIRCSELGILYEIRVRRESDKNISAPTKKDDQSLFTPKVNSRKFLVENYLKGRGKTHRFNFFSLDIFRLDKWANWTIYSDDDNDNVANSIELLNKNIRIQLNKKINNNKDSKLFVELYRENIDILANTYQNKYFFNIRVIILLMISISIIEGLTFLIPQIFQISHLFYLKLILIFIGLFLWLSNKYHKNKENWESYRAISESLRTQKFWAQASILESPADFLLSNSTGESAWIRRTTRSIWLLDYANLKRSPMSSHDSSFSSLMQIKENWVKDQLDYFILKTKLTTRFNNRCNYGIYALLIFWVLCSLLTSDLITHQLNFDNSLVAFLNSLKTISLLFAGCLKTFLYLKSYDKLKTKYELAAHLFNTAFLQIDHVIENKYPSLNIELQNKHLKKIYYSLGQSTLSEISDWYVANSGVKFEPSTDI